MKKKLWIIIVVVFQLVKANQFVNGVITNMVSLQTMQAELQPATKRQFVVLVVKSMAIY